MNQIYLSYRLAFQLYVSALFYRCESNDFINDEGIKSEENGQIHYQDRSGRCVNLQLDEVIQGIIEVRARDAHTDELIHYFPIVYKNNFCTNCKSTTTHFVGISNVCLECGTINKDIKVFVEPSDNNHSSPKFILNVNYKN